MGSQKIRTKPPLEPQQERSRESLRKLLSAAIEVLGEHGVDGATIPRIARHAGLTPGAVYRRFRDKDALLETAILELFEQQEQASRGLTPEMARDIPLRVFADQIIHSMVRNYRSRAPFVRALRQFSQRRAKTSSFKKRVSRLEIQNFEWLVDLFLTHSERIRHPDPRAAVSMGLTLVVSTVLELVVARRDLTAWKHLLPQDDQALANELTRAFLSYLGVEDLPGAAGKMEAEKLAAMNRWREKTSNHV
jgi:AcrR family transcriptional regulator